MSAGTEAVGGLCVIWRRPGWAVEHAAFPHLSAVTGLRQRRFAEQAREDLLNTEVDFTRPAADISRDHARWAPVYYLWKTRAGQESYDSITYEYYGSSVHAGTFVPSAGWAAAMRHATARDSYDEAEVARLLKYRNHAVNCPKKEDHRLHTVYLGENCPHCGNGDPLPGQGMPSTVADVPSPLAELTAQRAQSVLALRGRAEVRRLWRQRDRALSRAIEENLNSRKVIDSMRYEVKEAADDGYGVWDGYLLRWVEPDSGEATTLSEIDAEALLSSVLQG